MYTLICTVLFLGAGLSFTQATGNVWVGIGTVAGLFGLLIGMDSAVANLKKK